MALNPNDRFKKKEETTTSNTSTGTSSSKSNSSSQYTGVNLGTTYDANTDYQAIINNAVANGDYVTAAKAEQLRNQKIDATGSTYSKTNQYTGWLDSTDYGTVGQQQMANNASWEDVLETYNNRLNKATGTVGLEQYANDEIQQAMLEYIEAKKAESLGANGILDWNSNYNSSNPQPTYTGKYDAQTEALLNQILNRDDFSYDVANDPLYQQYANMYHREGDRAMKETMAEAAASAGGMNTYAITAAQQAQNYYASQLNDKVPELYQLAYQMYLQDKDSMVQDLGLLQNMDATQYNRYRDTMSDWKDDKSFAYKLYADAIAQNNWQTNFDYKSSWDEKDMNLENSRYEKEVATEEVWKFIKLGITPSAELIAKAGMSQADVDLAVAAVKGEGNKTTPTPEEEPSNNPSDDGNGWTGDTEPTLDDVMSGDISLEDYLAYLRKNAKPTTPEDEPEETKVTIADIEADLNYYIANGAQKSEIREYLRNAKASGTITDVEYDKLLSIYAPQGQLY